MDAFHFFEYMNANNIDYRASEVSAIINDVWKVSRIFKNMYNRPRPYQIAEAYNMDFDTMHGESNKTPAYPRQLGPRQHPLSRHNGQCFPASS